MKLDVSIKNNHLHTMRARFNLLCQTCELFLSTSLSGCDLWPRMNSSVLWQDLRQTSPSSFRPGFESLHLGCFGGGGGCLLITAQPLGKAWEMSGVGSENKTPLPRDLTV